MGRRGGEQRESRQRGASLALVGVSLVALIGMAGLAIDLASLYVGRTEAQRAADAAALAGAQTFVTSSCATQSGGCVAGGAQELTAAQQAATIGSQDLVGGRNLNISPTPSTVCPPLPNSACFTYPTPQDPEITVLVQQSMPTFFVKIFGVSSANVSASATAEAFPAGATACVKPWVLPNCDPYHVYTLSGTGGGRGSLPGSANPNCPITDARGKITGYNDYFVYESVAKAGTLVHPGKYVANDNNSGVIMEPMTLTPSSPTAAPAPSKYYEAYLPPGNDPPLCPNCPNVSPNACTGGALNSGDCYRENIGCCNQSPFPCGKDVQLIAINGGKVGNTSAGVACLLGPTPDTIQTAGSFPYYEIFSATGRALPTGASSSSVVSVPIWDGPQLCPGNQQTQSCTTSVHIYGIAQMFIDPKSTTPPGSNTVYAYILNIGTCGGGGINGGAKAIAVRLIHN